MLPAIPSNRRRIVSVSTFFRIQLDSSAAQMSPAGMLAALPRASQEPISTGVQPYFSRKTVCRAGAEREDHSSARVQCTCGAARVQSVK